MPAHPEECTKCGRLTHRRFHAGNVLYVECEHCGHSGMKGPYVV